MFGRKRHLRDLNDTNYAKREAARRAAMNAPVQGSAADLLKIAMIAVDKFLKENTYKCKMVLTIHDEILFAIPDEEIDELLPKIKSIMENLRNNPPKTIGDYKVLKTRDYDKDEIVDLATGEKTTTGIPKSNVLYYEMEGDAWLAVRPSGTEPKIKLYYGVVGDSLDDADKKSVTLGEQVKALLDSL